MTITQPPSTYDVVLACPVHGGPPIPRLPHVTFRSCPGSPALVVGGRVVAHLGPGELDQHRADLAVAERMSAAGRAA